MLGMLYEFVLIVTFTAILDPMITAVMLVYLIPYTLMAYVFASVQRELSREERQRWERRDGGLQEGIAGIATVKSFGRRRFEVRRYVRLNIDAQRVGIRRYWTLVLQDQLIGGDKLLSYAVTTGLWIYFARQVVRGELSLGLMLPLLAYTRRITEPVRLLVDFWNWVRLVMIPAERFLETMDATPAVRERPGARRLAALGGAVRFEDVSFAYEPGRPVLRGLRFTVPAGSRVAIVGPSGSGKSTLLQLLLRLHDPTEGSVRVDEHDLRDLRVEGYQQQIGVLLQETYLFGGTIAANLRLMHPAARPEELERAARLAGIDAWVREQPHGYEQDLREGGALSAGQKQRLGIARALAGDPRLLVLDEPTSALDAHTEAHVMQTLRAAAQGRTTFVATHRLHTVTDADLILVLQDGQIVQRGRHPELLAAPGLYREMHRRYTGRGEEPLPTADALAPLGSP